MSMMSELFNYSQSLRQKERREKNIRGHWSCVRCHYINVDVICHNCGHDWDTPNKRFLPDGQDNQDTFTGDPVLWVYLDPEYSHGSVVRNHGTIRAET